MEELKITLVQTRQFWENKSANLEHFTHFLEKIGETDLVLFPEMFHTGFSMNAENLAEEYKTSLAKEWLVESAKKFKTALYTSFICKENGHYFNRGVFVLPDGRITIYDKKKLFTLAKEEQHYTAGNKKGIVKYKGFNLLLTICYDLRFPEIQRNRMISANEAEYDVILNVANWPERRNSHWKTLLRARAIENQCFIAGVNRVGEDENQLQYSGDSAIIGPFGEELSNIKAYEETFETIQIHKQRLIEVREKLNFLKDQS